LCVQRQSAAAVARSFGQPQFEVLEVITADPGHGVDTGVLQHRLANCRSVLSAISTLAGAKKVEASARERLMVSAICGTAAVILSHSVAALVPTGG
jgi:hypothetical protein